MVKVDNENEATGRIEAALYSAGRPLSIEELIRASGTESRPKTLNLLTKLIQKTKSSFRAIEITNLPDGSYVFQLKPEYSSTIGRKYASRPMLPRATQKTLSYIAYEQPISSKQLVEVRGTGVYAHLKELTQLDFIEHQTVGRYKIFTTTEKFKKYFGIQGDDDTLRQKLFKKVRTRNTMPSTAN
tara:strand:- start:77 stop:631 length:555 start_codon:yes stop_codon:yes gene_type:complete